MALAYAYVPAYRRLPVLFAARFQGLAVCWLAQAVLVTTQRAHAIIERKVINNDNGGQPLVCCWDECDRLGYQMYAHTMCEHAVGGNCAYEDRKRLVYAGRTAHLVFVFCSWRHRAYWVNASGFRALESIENTGRAYGNLPVGMRHRDQVG